MVFDSKSIMIYIGILILALFMITLFIRPLKWLLKLIINTLLGGAVIILINMAGGIAGVTLALNPLSAAITGILGFPGLAAVIAAQLFIY